LADNNVLLGKDAVLLEEIRTTYDRYLNRWDDIRKEGRVDVQYLSGKPWTDAELEERKGRPSLALDELNQYVNKLINDIRQNKRSVKVTPEGSGANDKTAEFRGNLIRQIEYKSKAQSAYNTAFENACQRGYGFFAINTRYKSASSFDKEIVIRRIPDADSVLIDPDTKEADCSDMDSAFIVDGAGMTKAAFKAKYPNAEFKDFSSEHMEMAPKWITDERVIVAEFYKRKKTSRVSLLLNENGDTQFLDEFPGAKLKGRKVLVSKGGEEVPILDSRKVEDVKVCQYITNGVEVLEENEWPGKYIPIIPVFGKEMYVPDGSGSKRVLMSLVRLARDAFKLYCFARSGEAELLGQVPKIPYLGYEGQFDTETDWANINKRPTGYAEVKATTEATGNQVLPLPQRQIFEPPIQAYEMAAESAKRAIQSALGMYNASVGKHDTKATSGKAIAELDAQSDQGSFHFIDNYDIAIENCGRQLDDLIPKIYDNKREVGLRKADDTHEVVTINDPANVDPKTNQPLYATDSGEHSVTISTGPSYDAQRDEVEAYIQALVGTPLFPMVADLLTKMKNMGPLGDEVAKRLVPPKFAQNEEIPPQAMQAIQAGKQQFEQMHAYAQKLEKDLGELQKKVDAKMIDNQFKLEITKLQERTKIVVASLAAKSKMDVELAVKEAEHEMNELDKDHEAAMEGSRQVHEHDMAAHQAALTPAPEPQANA
jgi:hypothetical protein